MGKGDRRGKQARKRFEELAGVALAPPKPDKRHQNLRQFTDDPAPWKTATDARSRQMRVNEDDARLQVMETDATRALFLGAQRRDGRTEAEDRAYLYTAFAGLEKANATYHRRILGKSVHAKTAKIEMEPVPMEVDHSVRPDHRDDDTKDRDAVNAWMTWHGLIGRLPAHQRIRIWDGILGRALMVNDARLTGAGRAFVAAVRALAIERERKTH